MAKKKRTKAQRVAAAKAAWARRRLAGAAGPGPGISTVLPMSTPGYETLARELQAAYEQSSAGKGKVRHANGKPFDRQPIMEIGRMVGPGYNAGQAAKKATEALSMLGRGLWKPDQALAELHGAIVYLAATAALIRGE